MITFPKATPSPVQVQLAQFVMAAQLTGQHLGEQKRLGKHSKNGKPKA